MKFLFPYQIPRQTAKRKQVNALARLFYAEMGCQVPEGYRFDCARHPQEQLCCRMAEIAQKELLP